MATIMVKGSSHMTFSRGIPILALWPIFAANVVLASKFRFKQSIETDQYVVCDNFR